MGSKIGSRQVSGDQTAVHYQVVFPVGGGSVDNWPQFDEDGAESQPGFRRIDANPLVIELDVSPFDRQELANPQAAETGECKG
nr:hypothetical protein [Neorhodopirellula pilleata]